MARVTVEDCIEEIPNRFELVLLASQRAKELASGAMLTVDRDRDKNPVVALREIADKTVSLEHLREGLVKSFQRSGAAEEEEEDLESLLAEDSGAVVPASQQEFNASDAFTVEDEAGAVVEENDEDEDFSDVEIDEEE